MAAANDAEFIEVNQSVSIQMVRMEPCREQVYTQKNLENYG